MSRKKIAITILIVLTILLLCLVGYYFIISNNSGNGSGVVSTFRSFIPFGGSGGQGNGQNNGQDNPQNNQGGGTDTNQGNLGQNDFIKKLRKLSNGPVSGAGSFETKAGTIVRYTDKATGHIFQVEMFSPKADRISNTTMPMSYDTVWGNNGSSFISRFLKDDDVSVNTVSVTIKNNSTSTQNTIVATAFPERVSDVSVNGNLAFYLLVNSDGSTGFVSNIDGSKSKLVWSSPIKELTSQFVNQKTVAVNTKPAEGVPGFLYLIDTTTGAVNRLLGKISGLVSLVSPDASRVLYLSQDNELLMYILDVKKGTSSLMPFITFPEKCVWGKKNANLVYCAVSNEFKGTSSLTDWYKGLVSYSDKVMVYNSKDGSVGVVSDITADSGEKIDLIKPILSDNEQYLIFVNKTDNALWSLDLSTSTQKTN